MKKGLTSVIIPIYNTDFPPAHYTGFCIGNVKQYTKGYEIIVVDNASPIGLGGWEWDKVVDKYHRFKENKGFAGGMNKGIKMAEGEYICLLSNDVFVYDHWLEDLKDSLQYADAVNPHPMYGMPWGRRKESMDLREKWLYKKPEEYLTEFYDFSCVLTTRKVIDKVGMLDENFGEGYSEDVDWRIRLEEKGLKQRCDERVNTLHLGGATRYEMEKGGFDFGKLMDRNKEYLIDKHGIDKYGIPKWRRE